MFSFYRPCKDRTKLTLNLDSWKTIYMKIIALFLSFFFWCTTFIFLSLRGIVSLGGKNIFRFLFELVLGVFFAFIFWCFLKVYMTDFSFICSIKSPQCSDKCSKKNTIAIFLPCVLMCQKRQISLLLGYKTVTPKTGDWEGLWRQFRTPSLAKNRFLSHFLIVS